MSVIFLFVDGVGLGKATAHNPFVKRSFPAFEAITGGQPFTDQADPVIEDGHLFIPVDANLGMEGLPQSGTGQTTLFTGKNAAEVIGKHFGPFPHSGIKHLLREQSVFIKVQRMGFSCHFINAYPDIYFEKSRKRNRWSCTTLMTMSAGIPLNTVGDVKQERGITAGITQEAWREKLDIDVPVVTPEKAASRLLKIAEERDLVLSEYYLTDKAGHDREINNAIGVIKVYDRFLMEIIQNKRKQDTILLSSDHGNVEDLNQKSHTRNRVPLYVWGPGSGYFRNAKSIKDITPGLINCLRSQKEKIEDH